ncbi:MAG TPA: glycosyltransferase, partial [Vicinamibacterales bacterium]|nr:glycosyltransferase [Vicinamibacterales bacterium]
MYGPRATQVARTLDALVSHGWQSTVVCLDPRRGGPTWRDGKEAVLPRGVDALRVKSPEEWTAVRALWRVMPWLRDRPDAKWVWVGRAAAAAEAASARTQFDGLVTFAQPWSDHLVGLRVHRATKLPWVAHFSDPWVDGPYRKSSPRRRAASQRMEAQVIDEATAVVFVSEETADLVMAKYPEAWRAKAAVVPHGFVGPMRTHDASPRQGPMRLVHTGRF